MNAVAKVDERTPSEQFRTQLSRQEQEIATALPPHMPVERFMRVVLTAVNGNPDLLQADRRSLFESAMKAAQDGLLPDGRDGALVIYNTRVEIAGKKEWIKKVQWMPMVGGILKKVRNSGELLTISAYVAYENDEFEYTLGDDETIKHKPHLGEDRGQPRLVYAIAKTKDGGVYREIMTFREVEKVRGISRAKDNGPWKDWWDEMAKKTVIRRLAKRLPMSSDLDDLIRRDDDLYDFQGRRADMDGMHRQLAGPSVMQRLQAKQEQPHEAPQAREGFDADFVTRETATLVHGQEIEQEPASESPSSEAEGSAAAHPHSPAGAPDLSAESGEEGARDSLTPAETADSPAVAPSSATLSDEDRQWLVRVFKTLKGCVGPSVEDFTQATMIFKDEAASKSALVKAKATKIREELEKCCGEAPTMGTLQAAKYIAGLIGVEERELSA